MGCPGGSERVHPMQRSRDYSIPGSKDPPEEMAPLSTLACTPGQVSGGLQSKVAKSSVVSELTHVTADSLGVTQENQQTLKQLQ